MTDTLLQRLENQRVGEDVLHRYQRLVDAKDLDGLSDLVTDDVLLRRQNGDRHGREEFLGLYRRFAESDVVTAQHMASNVEVVETAPDTLRPTRCASTPASWPSPPTPAARPASCGVATAMTSYVSTTGG